MFYKHNFSNLDYRCVRCGYHVDTFLKKIKEILHVEYMSESHNFNIMLRNMKSIFDFVNNFKREEISCISDDEVVIKNIIE